eukprot:NODE_574_length_6555_cov_0.194703.p5 type:complete len:100 gc:universal NODE_574_length_6555_cov_0.194703:3886-3587(-)
MRIGVNRCISSIQYFLILSNGSSSMLTKGTAISILLVCFRTVLSACSRTVSLLWSSCLITLLPDCFCTFSCLVFIIIAFSTLLSTLRPNFILDQSFGSI